MKTHRWLIPLGMIAVLSFLLLTILGKILWPEYNPVTSYVSVLVTDESPHAYLMRFFMNTYTVCFLLFSLIMLAISLRKHRLLVKLGYITMFIAALFSAIGYGTYPISMAFIFSKNDIIHMATTIAILSASALSLLLLSIGYLKQENLLSLGYICFIACILFVSFNLWHLYSILNDRTNLGLIERCTFYTFHALTVILSWAYALKKTALIGRRSSAYRIGILF